MPDEAVDALCDPYLAALAMKDQPEARPKKAAAKRAKAGTAKKRRSAKSRTGRTHSRARSKSEVSRPRPRKPAAAKSKEHAESGSGQDPKPLPAIPLNAAAEPEWMVKDDRPPWQGDCAPLARSRSLTRTDSQGFLAHVLGWLGESLRRPSPRAGQRGLSPSVVREIERLRAENAALHRQVEALLALRESERRNIEPAAR